MARITVEDCLEHVENRFELVLLGAKRARQLSSGAPIQIERQDTKNTVTALREIAQSALDMDQLRDSYLTDLRQTMIENNLSSDMPSRGPIDADDVFGPGPQAAAAAEETSATESPDAIEEQPATEEVAAEEVSEG